MNFKEFDKLIHSQSKRITLAQDVILEEGEEVIYKNGIEIDLDGLVIDGCGHTIDARDKTRIFNIRAQLQVTIKNITFKNAFHSQGGAINNYSKLLTIGCCNFENNAADDGGAIYNHAYLKAINCTFENNYSKNSADIYNWETLILKGCEFKNKNQNIIFSLNNVIAEDCSFEDHHKIENKLVKFSQDDVIEPRAPLKKAENVLSFSELKNLINESDEVYLDCDVEFSLGDEQLKEGITIVGPDCTKDDESFVVLENDLVIDGKGHTIDGNDFARIFNICNEDVTIIFRDIRFQNAYFPGVSPRDALKDGGGAIYNNKSKCRFEFCEFFYNRASFFGGAIYNNGGEMSFYECNFDNNHSEGAAGVIFNHAGDLDFTNCVFTNNSAEQAGAVLSDFVGDLIFKGCCFKKNSTKFKGIIALAHNGSFDFDHSIFFENTVREGLYIYETSIFDVM